MANQLPPSGRILALDIGKSKIGVASASVIARLPQPEEPLDAKVDWQTSLQKLIREEDVRAVIVGLPKNLAGELTDQSRYNESVAKELAKNLDIPVICVDESLSTVRAAEMKKDSKYKNASEDSLAACFILKEYLDNIDLY